MKYRIMFDLWIDDDEECSEEVLKSFVEEMAEGVATSVDNIHLVEIVKDEE